MKVIKKTEFNEFLKIIGSKHVAHWVDIAKALNVDNDTITKWKSTPEAQKAISQGIEDAIEQMQTVGRKDWRMWESKLKMLGVNPAIRVDQNTTVNIFQEIIAKYGGSVEGVIDEVPRPEGIEEATLKDSA